MSGGAAVKADGGVEGDHPVCTTNGRKTGDTPRRRPQGLALTARGPQAPKKEGKPAGWPSLLAQGIVTGWPRPQGGSGRAPRARSAQAGCALVERALFPERFQRKGRFQQTLKPGVFNEMLDGPNRAARFVGDNQMDLARRDHGGGTGISTA